MKGDPTRAATYRAGVVTAPAEKHSGQDHHPELPGPRRDRLAEDPDVKLAR
jgi:hypothetical protein